jgi:hypothetical protein
VKVYQIHTIKEDGMHRRLMWGLAVGLMLVTAQAAYAGGWATVTLDEPPSNVHADTTLTIGFTVKQHDRTPIDNDPFGGGPLKPYLTATNTETGETLQVDARKDGPLGHFVVDVTFPSAGTWTWEIVPPPFAGTQMQPLTVQAAASTSTLNPQAVPEKQPAAASVADNTAANPSGAQQPLGSWRIAIGAAVLVLALLAARMMTRRTLPRRPSRA